MIQTIDQVNQPNNQPEFFISTITGGQLPTKLIDESKWRGIRPEQFTKTIKAFIRDDQVRATAGMSLPYSLISVALSTARGPVIADWNGDIVNLIPVITGLSQVTSTSSPFSRGTPSIWTTTTPS
jgi:hypothetical protein